MILQPVLEVLASATGRVFVQSSLRQPQGQQTWTRVLCRRARHLLCLSVPDGLLRVRIASRNCRGLTMLTPFRASMHKRRKLRENASHRNALHTVRARGSCVGGRWMGNGGRRERTGLRRQELRSAKGMFVWIVGLCKQCRPYSKCTGPSRLYWAREFDGFGDPGRQTAVCRREGDGRILTRSKTTDVTAAVIASTIVFIHRRDGLVCRSAS